MSDDEDQDRDLLGELKRLHESAEQRAYPSYWHANRCSQTPMEIHATRTWAREMNKRGRAIDVCSIAKNDAAFPDCIAAEDGRRIGVEVAEFTVDEKDRKRYVAGKKEGRTNVLPYAAPRAAPRRPRARAFGRDARAGPPARQRQALAWERRRKDTEHGYMDAQDPAKLRSAAIRQKCQRRGLARQRGRALERGRDRSEGYGLER